jgi:hypothetical protein
VAIGFAASSIEALTAKGTSFFATLAAFWALFSACIELKAFNTAALAAAAKLGRPMPGLALLQTLQLLACLALAYTSYLLSSILVAQMVPFTDGVTSLETFVLPSMLIATLFSAYYIHNTRKRPESILKEPKK